MIERTARERLTVSLRNFPVTALVGARQTGKTTLAKSLSGAASESSIYLDLERPSDLAKLTDPESYLEMHSDKLVILDEIQRVPELFPVLRSVIDDRRRNGRFLILGSASPTLMRQSSESLAGRIQYIELNPLTLSEVGDSTKNVDRLWLRGGFPNSYTANSEDQSIAWREAFVQTYLERDLPALGIRVPTVNLRRFWQMLAHSQGQLWNASKIAASLGVTSPTVKHYLDVLASTFIVRYLQPYHGNLKKRLLKSPKVYLRDSGLLHALLLLTTVDDVLGHPAAGASWEGWIIEQILADVPESWGKYFYRTAGGAEADLVLCGTGNKPRCAIEIKRSSAPSVSSGFRNAVKDLGLSAGYVVCNCREAYSLGDGIFTVPVTGLSAFAQSVIRS